MEYALETAGGRLAGKVALVTGGSRGIGRAVAIAFAREGARVALTYKDREKDAAQVVQLLEQQGIVALALKLEAGSRNNMQHILSEVTSRWGKLDILVNNAGYLQQKPYDEITDDDWNYTIDVNLKSVFLSSQLAAPIFKRQKSGNIINVTSVGGQTGGTQAPHYAAAKAAVISLTKSFARLLSPFHVQVNAISPGYIRTDMYRDIRTRVSEETIYSQIPLGRIGEPEEVAAAALYLASPESSYVTGHVLNVNGGLFLGSGS